MKTLPKIPYDINMFVNIILSQSRLSDLAFFLFCLQIAAFQTILYMPPKTINSSFVLFIVSDGTKLFSQYLDPLH